MSHFLQYILALLALLIATMSFERVYAPYSQQQQGSPSPAPRRVPQAFPPPSQEQSPFDTHPTTATVATRPRLFTSDASTRPSLARFIKPKPDSAAAQPHSYSESWQRLERGEKLPAPARPSSSEDSSSGEGGFPPGKDRDFGWFARQRERDDKILAIRRARQAAKLTDEGKKRYDWKNWKQGVYVGPGSAHFEEQKEKESGPPAGASTHMEGFRENVPPTGASTNMGAFKENVPPTGTYMQTSNTTTYRTAEKKARYDWRNWKQGKYVGPKFGSTPSVDLKENVPPTGTTTHLEGFKENVRITGTYTHTQMDDVKENVPPSISDSDSDHAGPERTWDVDFTAQSLMTSPKMRIVENAPANMEHPAENQNKEAKEPVVKENQPRNDYQKNFPAIMEDPAETQGNEAKEPVKSEEKAIVTAIMEQPEAKKVQPKEDEPKEAKEESKLAVRRCSVEAADEMWETLRNLSRCSTPSNLSTPKATPKVTGAYIETPAPERASDSETFPELDTPRPAPDAAGEYLKSPARRGRLTKLEPSTKQEAPTPAQEITGAYIETPAPRENPKKQEEDTEPTKPKLHISAKPPTFKEDLRRIKRETDYQDSTDEDAEAVKAPIADSTIDPDKVILGRMSQQLKMTSSSIRDARLGIERLESRVSASGAVYIRLHIPRWLWMLLAIILALFVTVMAIGAYEEHMVEHIVPGSAADWWGGSNGPVVLSWSGGSGSGGWKEQGFGADEYLF